MLTLPPFAYAAPDRMDDLLALAAHPGARLLAGGTDLVPALKHRLAGPELVVSLRRLPELHGIHENDGGMRIGAAATLADVRRAAGGRYPALASACASVATATLQETSTIGGNLMLDTRCAFYNQPAGWRAAIGGCLKCGGDVCHVARSGTGCYAAHSADTAPVLWLAGARVELRSTGGTREVPVAELYDGADGRAWIRVRHGEVLTAVILPPPGAPIAWRKVRLRGAIDYGALLVAVQRRAKAARAVISAVGPAPFEVIAPPADLAEAAWETAKPLGTHLVATSWRRHMVRVSVRRALAELG